jgi:hypothetical protein
MRDLATARLLPHPLRLADAPGMFELGRDPAVHRCLGGIGGLGAASLAGREATIHFS